MRVNRACAALRHRVQRGGLALPAPVAACSGITGRRAGARGGSRALLLAAAVLAAPSAASAAKFWTNATLNDQWFTASNWSPSAVPTQSDDLIFPASFPGGRTLVSMPSGVGESRSLRFENGYTLTGSLVNQTGEIVVNPGITATVSAGLNGNQGLRKLGTGTLILNPSVTNIYTNGAHILAGTLDIGADSNLGNFSNAVFLYAATLRTRATLSSLRPISLLGINSVIETAGGTTFTAGGVINDGGALVKTGAGTLVLNGANTYFGGTVINGGTLSINADTRLGNAGSTVTFNGGTLATTASFSTPRPMTINAGGASFNVATGTTFTAAGVISGTGALTKVGGGTLVAQAPHTYSGGTVINGGTLAINLDSHLGGPGTPITFNGGTLSSGSSITMPRPVTLNSGGGTFDIGPSDRMVNLSGAISGAGGLTKTGTGTLWLSGGNPNTYAGLTTVNGGTLRLQRPGVNSVPGNVVIGDGSGPDQLLVNAAEQIPNTANVSVLPGGEFVMNGVNETIGSLTMTSGFVFNGGGASLTLGAGGVTTLGTQSQIDASLNLGGATRTFDITDSASANDAVVNGVISNGNLLKTNAGTLLLTGNLSNTHGTTTVLAGTLVLQKTFEGPIAAPGNVTVGDGSSAAILRISQSEQIGNAATLAVNDLGTVELPLHQETIGGLTMTGNAQIIGGGLLVLQGDVTTNAAASSATIAPQIDLGGGSRSFTIADGPAEVDMSLSGEVSNGSLVKLGPGRLDLKRVRDLGSLTAVEGTIRMMDDSSDAGVSVIDSAGHGPNGRIDVRNTRIVARNSVLGGWNNDEYNGTLGLIQSGRNGGTWDGAGFITSMPDAQPATRLTSLGAATAGQVGKVGQVWGGATLVASDVLIMYTFAGDANLDGKINIDDYGRIDSNVGTGANGWFNGDFNYDGKINIDDYGIIDANISQQGASMSPLAESLSIAAVPDPWGLPLIGLAPLLGVRRRPFARPRPRPRGAGLVPLERGTPCDGMSERFERSASQRARPHVLA